MTIDHPGRELRYGRPSAGWLDGLPLGNGRTGAMVLAAADRLHLQLNDGTAWSGGVGSAARRGTLPAEEAARARAEAAALWDQGRIVDAERALSALQQDYVQAYLPFADLVLRIDRSAAPVERRLRLRDGEHLVTAGVLRHHTFLSAPDGLLVHLLTSDDLVDLDLSLTTPLGAPELTVDADGAVLRMTLPADVAPGHEPDEPALTWQVDGVTPLTGAVALSWWHDGTRVATADGVRLTGVRRLELRLATATTFDRIGGCPPGVAADRATAVLAATASATWSELRERHLADHRGLMDRFGLSLGIPRPDSGTDTDLRVRHAERHPDGPLAGDPDLLALLADYGRYLLIAASRPGGLPATLQGLWNDDLRPPWSSAYTLNINTEMNYWPAGPTGLAETAEPLLELAEALAVHGADTARRLYGARGWVAHHNTDAWANTRPTAGDASWALWPMGGVWLVRQLDELRRLGVVDDAWRARLWPLAVGAVQGALDLLTERPDGTLASWPSTSPENRFDTPRGPASLTRGSGMDRALLHELAATVRGLATELGESHPVLAELDAALPRIPGPVVADDGTVREWDGPRVEVEPEHRHVSALVFAYPGEGPGEHAEAVAATLDRRGDDSTGWSVAWKAALWARLGDGERAGRVLGLALRAAWGDDDPEPAGPSGPASEARGPHAGGVYRNLFAAHPPFQIDGNLGLTAAVAELLVSGVDGTIRLLPALPAALAEAGEVHGLIVHPGVAVALQWTAGVPRAVELTALSARSAGPREVRWRHRLWRVELAAGKPVRVPV
jgi:alpha-L-fucosidase 2